MLTEHKYVQLFGGLDRGQATLSDPFRDERYLRKPLLAHGHVRATVLI